MKKLLWICVLTPALGFCQCDNIADNVDPYTKVRKIETIYNMHLGGSGNRFVLEKNLQKKPYICWDMDFSSSVVLTVPNGEPLYIKNKEGKVLQFKTQRNGISTGYSSDGFTNYTSVHLYEKDVQAILSMDNADGIKYYIQELSIDSAEFASFKNNLQCFSQKVAEVHPKVAAKKPPQKK
jgi:hypothetical protein